MSQKSIYFPELQGLRAVAVLVVLLFHANQTWVPGGYIGVDVFFVISGFVITASLMREIAKSDNINIPIFYVRRVRRLLPAAGAVLLFVVLGTCLLLPIGQWSQIGFEVIASSLYFENWVLFADATNYLAQEEADSPIVHYWSLSIEEQFYFIWPILIFLALKFSSAISRKKNLLLLLCVIFFSSLIFSIIFTHQSPQQGYFSTFTRMWELALGAIIAILAWRPKASLGNVFSATGVLMILAASLSYSDASVFPGYLALLPTLGAVLVILAATSGHKLLLLAPLRAPFMLYTGNISYSLYLWHWPLIVFGFAIIGDEASSLERLGILAISFAAAAISTYLLEDPFRQGRFKIAKTSQAIALALITIGAPVAGGSYLIFSVNSNLTYEGLGALPGAAALQLKDYNVEESYDAAAYLPRPETARADLPAPYAMKCHANQKEEEVKTCDFGKPKGKFHIAIVGDSHAAQWQPALAKICETKDCKVTSITKSACPLAMAKITKGKPLTPYTSCINRHPKVLKTLEDLNLDVILTSQSRTYKIDGEVRADKNHDAMVGALVKTWGSLKDTKAKVFVIADTPRLRKSPVDCMGKPKSEFKACTINLAKNRSAKDPLIAAVNQAKNVTLIDMNSYICPNKTCYPVIGDVLVWRDSHHITATYSATLGQTLYSELGLD